MSAVELEKKIAIRNKQNITFQHPTHSTTVYDDSVLLHIQILYTY